MTDPTYTIRINPVDLMGKSIWLPIKDLEKICEKVGVTVQVVGDKYFEFTTDDVKNLFFLGLNFPRA